MRQRLNEIRDRIERACEQEKRDPADITLIAVSKTVSVEEIALAYEAGQRHFGESRLQEAIPKIEALPKDIVWHYIGHLQSNKAKKTAETFSVIHALCTEGQLHQIDKCSKIVDGLIEINIAKEIQKSGIYPEALDSFVQLVLNSKKVRLRGLMAIGPNLSEPEDMRPYFRELKKLANGYPQLEWLSMGMSADFEVAIQEGSTHVRVGSAIFGERA